MFFKIIFLLFSLNIFCQNNIIQNYKKSVYEIVFPKPSTEKLSYASELPFNLIPYQTRVDKFIPIGTAFRIDENRFISAAHVINVINLSSVKEYYVRDIEKNIYKIKNIYKYSNKKDFISFDVENILPGEYLKVSTNYKINEKVYAVGNALGEGIIIRDGLLTSVTAEMENGKWNWLRFSAPASPGNSGGPLLNSAGEVIGIITMKSMNENLNYALPIGEYLLEEDNIAKIFLSLKYTIPIYFNYSKKGDFVKNVQLPKTYAELTKDVYQSYDLWTQKIVEAIDLEWKGKQFPYGKGSEEILTTIYPTIFPNIIGQGQDGTWRLFMPQNLQEFKVDDDGNFVSGVIGGFNLSYYKFSKEIDYNKFFSSSKYMMDSILKGLDLYRTIATEQVRITSMGKGDHFGIWTDKYGRKWLTADFSFGFIDSKILVFVLPTPEGAVIMSKADTTDSIMSGYYRDFKVVSNFIHVGYTGKFIDWQRFTSLDKLVPKEISTTTVKSIPSGVDLKSADVSLIYSNSAFNWSSESVLSLLLGYEKEFDKVVWKIKSIVASEEPNGSGSYIKLNRYINPQNKDKSRNSAMLFNKIKNREYPFDGEVRTTNNLSDVAYTIEGALLDTIYLLVTGTNNITKKDKLKGELLNIRKGLKIKDYRMNESIDLISN